MSQLIVQHAWCVGQHRDALMDIQNELLARGHIVKEAHRSHGNVNQLCPNSICADFSDCNAYMSAYPHTLINCHANNCRGHKFCIEHGVGIIAWAFPLHSHDLFDTVYVQSPYHLDLMRKVYPKTAEKCILTGWPKLQRILSVDRQKARQDLIQRLNLNPTYPIISFVPTQNRSYIYTQQLLDLHIPNLIIAPHSGDYKWFRGHSRVERIPPIRDFRQYQHYLETDRITELVAASDIIIGDYSSVLVESLVLDIPVIQLLAPGKLHNRSQDPMEHGSYELPYGQYGNIGSFTIGPLVKDICQVPYWVDAMIEKPETCCEQRAEWRQKLVYNMDKDIAKLIVDNMEKQVLGHNIAAQSIHSSHICKACGAAALCEFTHLVIRTDHDFYQKPFLYFRCKECGLIFSTGMDTFTPEQLSDWYAEPEYSRWDPAGHSPRRLWRIVNEINFLQLRTRIENPTILLHGLGTCNVVPVLNLLGFENLWITYSDVAHPRNVNVADLPLGSFDYIIANEVLEHYVHLEKEFKLIASLLKPGGRFIGSTGMNENEHEKQPQNFWYIKPSMIAAGHVTYWSSKAFIRLAKQCGLKSEVIRGEPWMRVPSCMPAVSRFAILEK